MKATEALSKTTLNAKKIDFFIKEIDFRSEDGANSAMFNDLFISMDVMEYLMVNGYSISQGVNTFGVQWFKVSW